jgi:hypothetical protein
MVDGLAGCTACVDTPCGWHSTCARQWQCRENRRAVGSTPSSVHWAWKGCLCWSVVILLGVFVSVCVSTQKVHPANPSTIQSCWKLGTCACVCHVGVRPRLGCCSSAFGWQQCVMSVSAARPHTCKHGSMHLSCRDYGRQGGWCTRYWWLVHVVLVVGARGIGL